MTSAFNTDFNGVEPNGAAGAAISGALAFERVVRYRN